MIVYLIASSFAGYSPGAFHVYGALRGDEVLTELAYTLTPAQAAKFNRNEPGRLGWYKAGQKSDRFISYEHLNRFAIREYQSHFPGATMLFQGEPSTCGPKRVLDGPEPFKTDGTALWRRAEDLHWYDRRSNWQEMDDISDQWDRLVMDCEAG